VQAPAPAILRTSSVPPPAPRSSPDTATGGLALGAAPPPLSSGAPTAPQIPTTVGGAGRAGPLEARTLEGLASVEGSGPPPVVPRLSVPDLVSPLIECLGAARTPTDIAALELKRVSSAILARTCPSAVPVRHANGRVSVYTRQPAGLLETQVRTSQRNKRLAVGVRSNPNATRPRGSRRLPPRPTAAEQVGLLASIGLSDANFNRIRVFFVGALSPMASLPALREARASLMTLPAMEVSLLDAGSHLAHLSRAVDRRLADLWSAGLFIERPSYDPQGVAIPQTRDYEIPSNGRPSYRDFCPPADIRDIYISIGLDRGGAPSSVKVVMGLLTQENPNRLGNTLLVAVCPDPRTSTLRWLPCWLDMWHCYYD